MIGGDLIGSGMLLGSAVISSAASITAGLLLLAMILASIRIIRGPSAADRVIALDMLGLLGAAAVGVVSLISGAIVFIDIALSVALIGFLASVAFAAFVERGSIGEDR